MATKGVLKEAIKKLEYSNTVLKQELRKTSVNSAKGKEILAKLARNDSMILDYKFRLEYE